MKLRIFLNILLSAAILAGAALTAKWFISHARKPAERVAKKVVPKVVAPAIQARKNQRVEVLGYGAAKPKIQIKITPQVTGIVVEKAENFISGKYVRKGQILYRIEETDYELIVEGVQKSIELLEAQLERLNQEQKNLQESKEIEIQRRDLAESQVEKVVRLVGRGAASDNELDLAKEQLLAREVQLQSIINQLALIEPDRARLEAEIASAEVRLKEARTQLARCVVKSPVSGRVLSCDIEVGEQIQKGNMCGQIYGTEIMEVPISVSYADLEWIGARDQTNELEQTIEAIVEWQRPSTEGTVNWRGRVDRIEAGLEAETRTAGLVVQVNNPSTPVTSEPGAGQAMLEPNMFCKVTVLGKKLAQVYILPRRAILPNSSVYVVEDQKLGKRAVTVARYGSEEVMILSGGGINQGDRVVTSVMAKPVIGMEVEAFDELVSDAIAE